MAPHECKQERRIEELDAAYVRHQRELYEGNGNKQPITVRMDRCERIVNWLAYVSTALLISTIIGAGTVLWQTIIKSAAARPAQHVSAVPYEPAPN